MYYIVNMLYFLFQLLKIRFLVVLVSSIILGAFGQTCTTVPDGDCFITLINPRNSYNVSHTYFTQTVLVFFQRSFTAQIHADTAQI